MQNEKLESMQELSLEEVQVVSGGFADEWWASNRDMSARAGLSRWDLYSAA